ncbi:MAG TPA: M6 family metalloprotease domain-containing protein [Methylomirabilota bacterium]|nr:M6 family metalloprotease domain-containing protein [Methylomirabilota bacterium]
MPLPTIGRSPVIEPVAGTVRVLVIAVAFSDVNYTLSIAQLSRNYLGMLSAYYHEISYGKLTVQGEVHGWYRLTFPKAHYGRDCKGINDPDCSGVNQSWQIAEDAVPLAEKDVDFRKFDYFVFIHSGRGQETSQISDDIWSVTYLDASVETNSITLTRFNIVPELESPPSVPNGVWCVEFAHNLGIPDLYNTSNGPNNAKPILGPWELMDKGSWNGDPPGSLPAHMTAWPKIQLGFINGSELATVDGDGNFTFNVDPTEIASTNIHAIKIPFTDGLNPTQYYLVEVRRQTGFDSALPAEGVLITYVNSSATIGMVRVVNSDPGVVDLQNAIWKVHQTYADSLHGLAITVTGEIGRAYQVQVVRGVASAPVIGPNAGTLPSHTLITIAGVLLSVEVTGNTSTQIRGLSGRKGLDNDSGMLFVFSHEDYWSFWMADMKFPLDIIWFDSNRQVVWIEPNLQPCTSMNCVELTPEAPAMYVLEVKAGFVADHQIKLGTTFTFNAS